MWPAESRNNDDDTFDFSNSSKLVDGIHFYDNSGNLIGFMVFYKLVEGANKIEFCRPNDNALAEEKKVYESWKSSQMNSAVEVSPSDITVVKSRSDGKYRVFVDGYQSGIYEFGVFGSGRYGRDDQRTIKEVAIDTFTNWMLKSRM